MTPQQAEAKMIQNQKEVAKRVSLSNESMYGLSCSHEQWAMRRMQENDYVIKDGPKININ